MRSQKWSQFLFLHWIRWTYAGFVPRYLPPRPLTAIVTTQVYNTHNFWKTLFAKPIFCHFPHWHFGSGNCLKNLNQLFTIAESNLMSSFVGAGRMSRFKKMWSMLLNRIVSHRVQEKLANGKVVQEEVVKVGQMLGCGWTGKPIIIIIIIIVVIIVVVIITHDVLHLGCSSLDFFLPCPVSASLQLSVFILLRMHSVVAWLLHKKNVRRQEDPLEFSCHLDDPLAESYLYTLWYGTTLSYTLSKLGTIEEL